MSTMDKVKNALHLNKDHSTTTTTGHTTTAGTTHNTHSTGVPEGTAGPHSSRVANAADPRVDSDLHSTHRTGAVGTGVGTHTGTHTGAGYGTTGTGVTGTSHSTTAGPHSSNLANKVDPRVDSDHDGSRNFGAATGNTGASAYGNTATGTHTTGTHHTGAGVGGVTGTHTTGTHGGISHSTNNGPHDSNLANKADPRVNADGVGHHGTHATPGSGKAQNTAGPHNSDLLNKLDPRVDADLDGSKTVGGNKTYT